MGRGLSDLQSAILRQALDNRESDERPNCLADVFAFELLKGYFGFPYPAWLQRFPPDEAHEFTRRSPWRHFFRKTGVAARHNSACAAISRALARLEQRGLVIRRYGDGWAGANLTDAGIEAARPLMRSVAV